MPLSPTRDRPRDHGNVVVFTMADGIRALRCRVQAGALDRVAGRDGEAVERFERHRAVFEGVASLLHDAGLPLCITADHVSIVVRRA